MHTLLDVLHVVTAVFLIGPLAVLPMSAMRALRAGQGPAVSSLARSTTIFGWASLAVVVFGFGVLGTSDKRYGLSISTSWIWISIVLYVIALGLTLFAVVPAMRSGASVISGQRGSTGSDAGSGAGGSSGAAVPPGAGAGVSGGAVVAVPEGAVAGAYRRIAMASGIASLLLVAVVVLMVAKP